MKKIKIIAFISILFSLLTSCNDNSSSTSSNYSPSSLSNYYEVTFDSNGGYFENNKSSFILEVSKDCLLDYEVTVKRNGYNFVGWTKTKNGDDFWNFSEDVVTSNITLYAFWNQSDYNYIVTETGVTITKYLGNQAQVVIPSEILNRPVVRIATDAFLNCNEITSIILPDTLQSIGRNAFRGCSRLTYTLSGNCYYLQSATDDHFALVYGSNSSIASATIHTSTKIIADYAFAGFGALKSIYLPSSIAYIGHQAFYGCYSLVIYCQSEAMPEGWDSSFNSSCRPVYWNVASEDLYTSNGLKYLLKNDEAMVTERLTSIKEITIPEKISVNDIEYTVTGIGDYAFYNTSSLVDISLSNSVTHIGSHVFDNCPNLTYYEFDGNGHYLGNVNNNYVAFIKTKDQSIRSINVNSKTTAIAGEAFKQCHSLTEVSLPSSLKSIGDSSFYDCDSLNSLILPKGLQEIGKESFAFCTALSNIVIPNSVLIIGDDAFGNCSNLTINCETQAKPNGWSETWNSSNRPVNWGQALA